MDIYEQIHVATAVKINGQLAGEMLMHGMHGFTAKWINGSQHTYTDEDIARAKMYNGDFIINNDVVEFFTLTPLATVR